MITIRYLSDLHLEFGDGISHPSRDEEDVVVLAGDISVGIEGIHWAQRTFAPTPVVYVLGNHEFYGHRFDKLVKQAKAAAEGSNVHVLENDAFVIKGYRILGCTLWTDFDLFGPSSREAAMDAARRHLSDHRLIQTAEMTLVRPVWPEETRARHLESRTWLMATIADSPEPVIVVTHHGPDMWANQRRYFESTLSAAFVSDMRNVMSPPVRLWIYGHTHNNAEFFIRDVPVVSNQRGYARNDVEGFDWNKTIVLDPEPTKDGAP